MRSIALTQALRRITRIVPLVLLVTACNEGAMLLRFTPHDADVRARDYLALLTRGRIDSVETRFAPELRDQNASAAVAQMVSMLAGLRLDSLHVVSAQVNTVSLVGGSSTRYANLGYEFYTQRGWYAASVTTVDSADTWVVDGLHVEPLPDKLAHTNAFMLGGRSLTSYVVLAIAMACVACSFSVAWLVAFRSRMRRRWLWALLALVGIGQVLVNWTTGEMAVNAARFQLFGFGFVRGAPEAPWILSFSFPVGAAIAYERYRRWKRGEEAGKLGHGLVFHEEPTPSESATV